jgi:hypothetical protein
LSDPRLATHPFQMSYSRYHATGSLAGPFHRKRSPTQSLQDDQKLIDSGMLWGNTPQTGKCPTAQAYFGPLPSTERGVEFYTPILPAQTGLPPGFGANWYLDDTAFTGRTVSDGRTYAAITIVVVRHVP